MDIEETSGLGHFYRLPALLLITLAGACHPADDETLFQGNPDEPELEPIAPEAVGAIAACAVCHGAQGEGNRAMHAPRIGGLADWYIERQLEHFRTGLRGDIDDDPYGAQMRAIVMLLEDTNQTISDLAAYVATLEPLAAPATISGDAKKGAELYTVCVACHGEAGGGSAELNTPSLTGQMDSYLIRQLRYYRDGVRGVNPQDAFGAQMVPVMQTFDDDQDIINVVAYINTLSDDRRTSSRAKTGAAASRLSGRLVQERR